MSDASGGKYLKILVGRLRNSASSMEIFKLQKIWFSRIADQNSRQENQRTAQRHLEQRRRPRRVHEPVADPRDDAQFHQHHAHGNGNGVFKFGIKNGSVWPRPPSVVINRTRNRAPGCRAGEAAVVGTRLRKAHADARAAAGSQPTRKFPNCYAWRTRRQTTAPASKWTRPSDRPGPAE